MKNNRIRLIVFGLVMLLAINACLFNVGRNDDGTLRVETNLSAEMIKSTLLTTANLPGDTTVLVELKDGYIQVYSDQLLVEGNLVKDVSFRLDMQAANGQLEARISNASFSGIKIEDTQLEEYNSLISQSLQAAGQQNDRATLDSVSITTESVLMVWRVDANINQ